MVWVSDCEAKPWPGLRRADGINGTECSTSTSSTTPTSPALPHPPSPLWGGPGWGSGGLTERQRHRTPNASATPTLTLPTRGREKRERNTFDCCGKSGRLDGNPSRACWGEAGALSEGPVDLRRQPNARELPTGSGTRAGVRASMEVNAPCQRPARPPIRHGPLHAGHLPDTPMAGPPEAGHDGREIWMRE